MKKTAKLGIVVLAVMVLTAGCAGYSNEIRRDMTANTAGGAALGAIAGGLIGAVTGDFGTGAAIGAVAGGVLGAGATPRPGHEVYVPVYEYPSPYYEGYERGVERARRQWEREQYQRGMNDGYYSHRPCRYYRYRHYRY